MNGTQLIRNLNWLGRTNKLLEMNVSDDDNEKEDDVKKCQTYMVVEFET